MLVWARFLLAWIWTLLCSVVACLLAVAVGPTRMWQLCRRPWGRGALAILGVRVRLEGVENLVAGAIYMANHQSLIDVVLLPAILPPNTRMVAKRQLLWVPFFGWAFAAGGAVLLDRERPQLALERLYEGCRRLPPGWSLAIFPEGTRSRDGRLRRLRRGAIALACHTHRPLVPVAIDGARDIVAMGDFLVRPGEVRISVGPPLCTDGWTMGELPAHLEAAQAALRDSLAQAEARRPAAARPPAGVSCAQQRRA